MTEKLIKFVQENSLGSLEITDALTDYEHSATTYFEGKAVSKDPLNIIQDFYLSEGFKFPKGWETFLRNQPQGQWVNFISRPVPPEGSPIKQLRLRISHAWSWGTGVESVPYALSQEVIFAREDDVQ
jgi:hypothetical protein